VLVSIVIDNYNYDRFVRAAIDSALSQSHQPVEVIVVDDGSTDQSRHLIQRYGSQITTVLKDNRGQASALNAGFAHSHGELVIFLDADDVLLPHTAQRVVDAFRARPDTAKVQYRMEIIDGDGKPTGEIKPPCHIPLPAGVLRKQELLFPFDLPWLPTSGNAFSTRTLRAIFPIPEGAYGKVGADWYMAHLTPLFGPVISLDEVCACYRVHASNHYELAEPLLNLAHIRQTIIYCNVTSSYLLKYADQLGLPDRPAEILSVSYIANRITSCRLEPDRHPVTGETPWKLFKLALLAISRRSDTAWLLKILFGLWFMCMVIAPKSLAHWLAEIFFFPQRRTQINHWLRFLHRSGEGA
jgi:glycosyltransferase involved in cell wall biosynthesis